jgi:hypothetical protein
LDEIAMLEAEIAGLARARRAGAIHGRTHLEAALPAGRVSALTQPAYFEHGNGLGVNVANLLVQPATIGGEPALALAAADGNYKDESTCLASAAAICEAARELAEPMIAHADVAPALRRALLAGDARIRKIAGQPIGARRFDTVMGPSKSLSGIGASVLAAVVGAGFVWIAHAGESRALVVRDGKTRRLVQPHTADNDPAFREAIARDPELGDLAPHIVTNVLGLGELRIDVLRAPVSPADRLILGNPTVRWEDGAEEPGAGAYMATVRIVVDLA